MFHFRVNRISVFITTKSVRVEVFDTHTTHTHTHIHTHTHTHIYIYIYIYIYIMYGGSLSQWPRGLRRRSAAARFLELRVRIPRGHGCLSVVSVVCCAGRGFCVELITRPEESYWMCRVWMWSWSFDNVEVLAHWELLHHGKTLNICSKMHVWAGERVNIDS